MRHVLALAFLLAPLHAVAQPITLQDGFAPLAAKVSPAVVNIRTESGSIGSGVIISADGLVVTNHHVVARSGRIVIALDEKKIVPATKVGSDPENDLAVLRLPPGTYASVPWGDSSKVRVGEFAFAIGNPLNVGKSFSMGIVSAVGRASGRPDRHEDYIQTDAAVNRGNSGGALVNTRGELIGINTLIKTESGGNDGIAFAISSNLTRGVVEQLIKDGSTKRGWLGVVFGVTWEGYVFIDGVLRNGPARRAGLRPGDVVLELGGKPIDDLDRLLSRISRYRPGEKIPVTIVRRNEKVTVAVTVGERPPDLDD